MSAGGEGPAETEPGAPAEAAARDHLRGLSHEDRVLLDVRDELYAGDWGELEADLTARLHGKPHIFRLASKIEEDLKRLTSLRTFEETNRIDLGAAKRRWEADRERAERPATGPVERPEGADKSAAASDPDGNEHEAGVAGSGGTRT